MAETLIIYNRNVDTPDFVEWVKSQNPDDNLYDFILKHVDSLMENYLVAKGMIFSKYEIVDYQELENELSEYLKID